MSSPKGTLRRSLESRGGGGGIAASRKRGFPRMVLVPTLKPWFMVNETTDRLDDGLQVGDYYPCHEAGYRLCQAKEDLSPGRATFWAGPMEAQASAASAKTNYRLLAAERGDREVYLETDGNFEEGDFTDGKLMITGGNKNVGRTFTIGYNEKSYSSNEISGNGSRYVTKILLQEYLDTDLDLDTDWLIQGNVFACQRHAPSSGHSQVPHITVGVPITEVKADEYFWCCVSGQTMGQLFVGLTPTSGICELVPYAGTNVDTDYASLGKLRPITAAADVPSQPFARLNVRSVAALSADAYVPIWLYGNMAV